MKTIILMFFICITFFFISLIVDVSKKKLPQKSHRVGDRTNPIKDEITMMPEAEVSREDVFCWAIDGGKMQIVSEKKFENLKKKSNFFQEKNENIEHLYYTLEKEKEEKEQNEKTLPYPLRDGLKPSRVRNANAKSDILPPPLLQSGESASMVKVCKVCHKPLKTGRSTKQFCDIYCKNQYHKKDEKD